MREVIYPHANTIVCIEDSKLLRHFQYEILYNADGLAATLDELNNINYFHTYKNADADNYDFMLDELMKATFDLMREIAPTELILRIFTLYYDIHNMKLVVKERFFGKRLDSLALDYGGYTMPTIRSAAVRESENLLADETLTKGFFEALRAKEIYDVDFIMDKTYLRTLKKLAGDLGNPGIEGFVAERIDLFNISAYFQSLAAGEPEGYLARAFSECGAVQLTEWLSYIKGGSLDKARNFHLWQRYRSVWESAQNREQIFWELDVLIDNYLIEKTKICKLMAFGIEPICAYFYNKFMEIKNIRILLAGKESGYDTEEIKRRMRKPYEL